MVHDPTDPVVRLLFTTLSISAEFEGDLARVRTREGMAVAKAKRRLRGKQPKLRPRQEAHLLELWNSGTHTTAEVAYLFSVGRSTVYRAIRRGGAEVAVTARWRWEDPANYYCDSRPQAPGGR